MNILLLSQYFWPESFIINDLVKTLRDAGHHVVVATGKPNYPEGRVFDGYRADGVQREVFDGDIEVCRVPLRPRGQGGLNLFLNYLSFVWSGLRWFPTLLRAHRFDAIIVFAVSPITMAIPAIALRRQQQAHLAIWVQDLWPESLAATGYIRSRLILRMVGWMVRAIYSHADTILVQSKAFIAPVSRFAQPGKIVYYANSVADRPSETAEDGGLPPSLVALLRSYFCVVFTGNIGTAQAVDTLVEAASRFRELPDVRLVLVGSGSMLDWAKRRVSELNLENVVMPGRLPAHSMPGIYRDAACLVVSLRDEEIFSYTVPAKVQAYLAAGRPIIACLNGEGARIVSEAKAGLTCAAGDAAALADCVRSLHTMPAEERARMGAAGRQYFLEHYEMGRQAKHLVDILEQRIAQGGRQE